MFLKKIYNYLYYTLWMRYVKYPPHLLVQDCNFIGHVLGTHQSNGYDYEDDMIVFYYRKEHYITDLKIMDKTKRLKTFYACPGWVVYGKYEAHWIKHIKKLAEIVYTPA